MKHLLPLAALLSTPAMALDLPPQCAALETFDARYACVEQAVIASTRRVDAAFASSPTLVKRDDWHTQTLRQCAEAIGGMSSESADLIFGLCIIDRNNAQVRALMGGL